LKKNLTIIGKLVHPYLRLLFTIFCFSSLILVDSAAMAQADRETFEQGSAPILIVIEGIEDIYSYFLEKLKIKSENN